MAFYDYQIAIGNNNAGSLVNVEALTGTAGNLFDPVEGWTAYSPGSARIMSSGLYSFTGYPSTVWRSGILRVTQYKYLYDTILVGAYSAPVTIKTTAQEVGTYANYNAIMTIPIPEDLTAQGHSYVDFAWTFTRLVAL